MHEFGENFGYEFDARGFRNLYRNKNTHFVAFTVCSSITAIEETFQFKAAIFIHTYCERKR